jgi:hypothetical protein
MNYKGYYTVNVPIRYDRWGSNTKLYDNVWSPLRGKRPQFTQAIEKELE